jgi:hypothetical protein
MGADPFTGECRVWPTELGSILAPDHNGENVVWIRAIQVQKRELPLAPHGEFGADDQAANRAYLADVLCGIFRGVLFRPGRSRLQERACERTYERVSKDLRTRDQQDPPIRLRSQRVGGLHRRRQVLGGGMRAFCM